MRRSLHPSAERAFSLLELILVIAIIALLVSIILPAIGGVHERAREARTIANLRSHATAMIAYTGDWDGQFVAMTDPAKETTLVTVGGREYRLSYWSPTIVWPLGMLDEYYDGQMAHPSLIESDDDMPQPWGNWAYQYSSSFLARAAFWNPSTREGVHQLGPTRLTDVTFPSRKGVLVVSDDLPNSAYESSIASSVWRIGFVDSSARLIRQGDLVPGYTSGEGGFGSGGGSIGFPVTHTIDGVRGFDTSR